MPTFTIVTTSATQSSDSVEVSTLSDDFADASECVGYARRMAEEMSGLAQQLSLDFDYSNVALYDGDLSDEEINPDHGAFMGMWVLDDDGAAFITAEEFHADPPADEAP